MAQATDVSEIIRQHVAQNGSDNITGVIIYRWRNKAIRRHVTQAKRIFVKVNKGFCILYIFTLYHMINW